MTTDRPCKDLYEAALFGLPVPVIVHDVDMIIYANERACEVLGAESQADIEGRPLSDIVHPDGREAGLQRRKLLLEQGGEFRDVALKLIDLAGNTLYLTGSARHITFCGRPAIVFAGTQLP